MRALFPLLSLVFAAVIPACTCSSSKEEPTTSAPAPTSSLLRTSATVRPGAVRLPSRIQLNPANIRPAQLPTPTTSASAP